MSKTQSPKVRYAVVGLGYFAQEAVLPAFAHARENSELIALVSGDPAKHKRLGARYKVNLHYSYGQYGEALQCAPCDAVYIALPNAMHKEYVVRAAEAGKHVLCEKPLATSEQDCREMIEACRKANVKLMTAYRLHFEELNLSIVDMVKKRAIGEPRFFSSVFSHNVRAGNIRARGELGGGGLWDLGVYCVNAARYLFQAEPTRAFAFTANGDPKRFQGVDEIASAVLEFPNHRLAQFTTSQSAAETSQYRIVGTKGDINVQPAYEYAGGLACQITRQGKTQRKSVPKRDQIAAEIAYFSDCVRQGKDPEPSGQEGLADVRVIQALYESAKSGQAVEISATPRTRRPNAGQKIEKPPVQEPELVHASSPSGH